MLIPELIAAATPTVARSVRHWIFRLGALGFIPLGLLDSSVIPLPGSMDVLTIVLASRTEEWSWWVYYAVMATTGSVLGAYVTYRLGRKGGEKALEKKISERRLRRIYKIFGRWGFASIALPALLPPPIPLVPFVLVAGAMQYSVKKFLTAMVLGRIIRYTILAFLGGHYGRKMLPFLSEHVYLVLGVTLALTAVGGGTYYLFSTRREKKTKKKKNT